MRVKINENWKVIPSSLSEITLQQRIDFQQQHGNDLDLMLKSITEMVDDEEKELELAQFQVEKAFRTLSFFLDCTVESLKETVFVDDLLQIYFNCLNQIFIDEQQEYDEQKLEFVWNDEVWYLAAPELKHGDKMTFGEFIDSKQMVQDMVNLGKNRWECLIPLCAIFLRRKDEMYDKSFLYENSEKLELMKRLPLDIALQVGFFLSSSLSILTRTSLFSPNQGSNNQENI